jgi:hypothetical protein
VRVEINRGSLGVVFDNNTTAILKMLDILAHLKHREVPSSFENKFGQVLTDCEHEQLLHGGLVAPTPSASTPSTRKSSSATAVSTATGLLRTRFVDLKFAAFDIHAIEFADGLCRVDFGPEFDEPETARPAGFPVGDDAGRGYLVSLPDEQLQQAIVSHAEREIPNIEFRHFLSLTLI